MSRTADEPLIKQKDFFERSDQILGRFAYLLSTRKANVLLLLLLAPTGIDPETPKPIISLILAYITYVDISAAGTPSEEKRVFRSVCLRVYVDIDDRFNLIILYKGISPNIRGGFPT